MRSVRRWFVTSSLFATLALSGAASAQDHAHDHPARDGAVVNNSADTQGPEAHAAPGSHGEAAHGGHGEHHVPTFEDINWFHGMLAEREGVAPSLLFRPPGMPAPVASLVLNALVVYYLLYRILGKTIREGLRKRKETILRGMEEAAKMKADAEKELASYEERLAKIEQEIERIRTDMRHAGEAERSRVLSEAKERRDRMERDARELVEQELAAVRQALLAETVQSAMRSAEATLKEQVTAADQVRLADEYIAGLRHSAVSLRGRA